MKAIKLTRCLILLLFGYYIRQLLVSGDIRQYIHPRFEIALTLAYVFIFLLALVQMRGFFAGHEHNAEYKREILSTLLLTVPLLFAFCFPSGSLNSAMIEKKTANPALQVNTSNSAPETEANDDWEPQIPDDRFLAAMMLLYMDPAAYVDKDIEFSGFVYHQDNFPADSFLVARYGIVCCAADAQVTGLLCRSSDGQKLAADQWVKIKGKITLEYYQDQAVPIIDVANIQLIKAPKNPYVY